MKQVCVNIKYEGVMKDGSPLQLDQVDQKTELLQK